LAHCRAERRKERADVLTFLDLNGREEKGRRGRRVRESVYIYKYIVYVHVCA
jgi:hypothetical protein